MLLIAPLQSWRIYPDQRDASRNESAEITEKGLEKKSLKLDLIWFDMNSHFASYWLEFAWTSHSDDMWWSWTSTGHAWRSVASFCLLTHLWKCIKSGLVRGASSPVQPFVLWGLSGWKEEVCLNLAISYSWMVGATHWAVDLYCPWWHYCWNPVDIYHV